MRFGRAPRLTFAYTLGYEGFARVAVGFVGHEYKGVKLIDGMRRDAVNVTQAAMVNLDVGHMMQCAHRARLSARLRHYLTCAQRRV